MPRSKADDRWTKQCKQCGKPFWQQRPRILYCSRECAELDRLAWARPKGGTRAAAGLDPRICEVCGMEFAPLRVTQLTCSRRCREALPAQRAKQRAADRSPERRDRQNLLRREASPGVRRRRAEDTRRHWLKYKYGLTVGDVERMLDAQDGVCMICRNPPNPDGKQAASRLHPDHDHVTGRTRDLLCLSCNVGIGHFRDDPVLLRAAAEYIERHRAAVMSPG